MSKLIVSLGPTASGKTALGEALALEFNGEIISADAKQIYRGMDIGTAKEKVLKVPQHLIDIKNPGEKSTVAEYQKMAYATIDDVLARGKQPFLVGGSMLYVEAVMNGYTFNNRQEPRYDCLKIGVELNREVLKEKAAIRLNERIKQGLDDEVRGLLEQGVSPEWLEKCGIEYRYFSYYVLGKMTLEEATEKTRIAINQYIKRQYTWWRRHSDIHWVQEHDAARALVHEFIDAV